MKIAVVGAGFAGVSAAKVLRQSGFAVTVFEQAPDDIDPEATVPLVRLAWGRSGDKGNLFNVGVFARQPRFYPYIAAALSADAVAGWFAHLVDDPTNPRADRYLLPGGHGLAGARRAVRPAAGGAHRRRSRIR